MTSATNPIRPAGPPPAYASVVRKVYPYSLRPIVVFTACLGFIWAIVMGSNELRDRNWPNASNKQKTFDLVEAIMYFVVAGIEAVIVVVAITQSLAIGRLIMVLAPLGFIITLAVQCMEVALHWTLKSDLIAQCVANTVGTVYSGNQLVNTNQATDICNAAWDRGSWASIVWLICSAILAGMFASIALSYYRQLLDPSSVRQRRTQIENYALQQGNYNPNYPPPPGQYAYGGQGPAGQQQGWMVPPYPGPPMNAPPPPAGGFEKSDYHPSAAWADAGAQREQEQAWAQAQANGPTAHVGTSHIVREERGYAVPSNPEEDEAWERARNEGVTAHLTGKPTSPRKEQSAV